MITEEQVIKLRLRSATKFILERIMYNSTGINLGFSANEVGELLDILNPTKPFHLSEGFSIEPEAE